MGKSFSEEERILLKKRIYEGAYKLFCELGYQKTTIKKITEEVGIGKGSFYNFYDSKEALFFRIMLDLEKDMEVEHLTNLKTHVAKDGFIGAYAMIIQQGINRVLSDPFFRITANHELMKEVWFKVDKTLQRESIINDQKKLEEQMKIARDHGVTLKVDLQVFTMTIRTLVFSLIGAAGLEGNAELEKQTQDLIIKGTIKELLD